MLLVNFQALRTKLAALKLRTTVSRAFTLSDVEKEGTTATLSS